MRLRRWTTIAVVLAVGLLATAGCRKKSRSSHSSGSNDGQIFTTDDFPGAPVQDNNVADDGKAMSPPTGTTFIGGPTNNVFVTMNGDRGTAIVVYVVQDFLSGGSLGANGLYVHYYDGERFTPPVALRTTDSSDVQPTIIPRVAFLNTSNHPVEAARERDGDAVIFWGAIDVDGDFAGPDGVNDALFSTYFDVTHKDNAGRQYGFQQYGSRVNTLTDGAGEDVETVAIVTDGLCGEARFENSAESYSYGDDTTDIWVAWNVLEEADGIGTPDDRTLYAARLDIGASIDADLPLTTSSETRIGVVGFGASDSGIDAEETQLDRMLVAYNDCLFFRVFSDADFSAGPLSTGFLAYDGIVPFAASDVTLQYVRFNLATGTISPATDLNPGPVDSLAGETDGNNADFLVQGGRMTRRSVYGEDEGLAVKSIFFTMIVEEATNWTDPTNSGNVWVAEIDPAGLLAGLGQVSSDDVAENDNVLPGVVDTQISRNGDYIWVAYLKDVDITGALDPGTDGLFAVQYVTTRPDSDGLFTLPGLGTTLSGESQLSSVTVTTPAVTWFSFQDSLGYVCGCQSDPDVMHVFFELSDGLSDVVFDARLTADLDSVVTPGIVTTAWQTFEDGAVDLAPTVNLGHSGFNGVDSGEGGNIFTVYTDDIGPTAGTGNPDDDFRLFSETNGIGAGSAEIDSAVNYRQTPFQQLKLVSTPPGSEIGHFDPVTSEDEDTRSHSAGQIHAFFNESRYSDVYITPGGSLALRTRVFHTDTDILAFGEAFVPGAGSGFQEPFTFDIPGGDDVIPITILGLGIHEDQVGVWFGFDGNIYYQEYSGDSSRDSVGWRVAEGSDPQVSDPALVNDHESLSGSLGGVLPTVFAAKNCTCDTLGGAMIIWQELEPDLGGFAGDPYFRLHARVRDEE
ncbi:MAG: hypothetical protein K8T20_21045 [Planctomycetes bacterium]|nr:hypothetical protein [Planctomycetota bacterium]